MMTLRAPRSRSLFLPSSIHHSISSSEELGGGGGRGGGEGWLGDEV